MPRAYAHLTKKASERMLEATKALLEIKTKENKTMADATPSADTPPVNNQPASSPADNGTPPQTKPQETTVILTKDAHDLLQRQAAQTATAQHDKDILQNKLDALSRRKVAPLPPLEAQAVATVKNQVTAKVLTEPKYNALLQKNPMIAKVLAKNPLSLLDQDSFLDEEDATNQVLDFLDEQVTLAEAAAPATPPISSPAASSPAPHATNPSDDIQPTDTPSEKEQKEQDERNKNLPAQKRIENSIASRLNIS